MPPPRSNTNFPPTNQPTNQPTIGNQPTNQPTNQPNLNQIFLETRDDLDTGLSTSSDTVDTLVFTDSQHWKQTDGLPNSSDEFSLTTL